MIEPVSPERWQEAQVAEAAVATYDHDNSAAAYGYIFNYLGVLMDQQWKQVIEIGCGPFPATSYCLNVHALVYEPLWFQSLRAMVDQGFIQWIRKSFEDAQIIKADEVWIFNCLQHVRDPELVVTKAKMSADTIRFFEPVDYPTCVYHPHTFTQADFERWFGDVQRYTDRLPGFFDADCCYGTWERK